MKSIRQEILIALNKHGEQTVDDLLDQINGDFSRKDIASNISQFSGEGLATRRKDGTTGLPAYKITDLGKLRIKSSTLGQVPSVVKPNLITESTGSPVKESLTAHHIPTVQALDATAPVVTKEPESKPVIVNHSPNVSDQKEADHTAIADRYLIVSKIDSVFNDPVFSSRLDDAQRMAKLAAIESGEETIVFAMVKVGSAKPVAEWVAA